MDMLQTKPLDRGLNAAILHIAGKLFRTGYDVSADAPSTFKALKAHLDAGKRMVVYNGGSDRTIYDDDEVNFAFRAWHDWCHWRYGLSFSPAGEMATCIAQISHLKELFGQSQTTERWADILWAEVAGQSQYYARHKAFVQDQRGFVEAYLVDSEAALSRAW